MSRDRDRGRGGGYGRGDSRDGRDSGPPAKVSLLVRNLTFRTRAEDVRDMFIRFGDIRDVYLPLDFGTQKPRGFAFVEFYEPAEAARAKEHLDGYNIDGRNISVLYAQEKRKRPEDMVRKERDEIPFRRDRGYGGRSRSRSRSRSRGYGGYASRRDSRSPPPRRRPSRSYSRSPRRRHHSASRERDRRGRSRSRSRSRGGRRGSSRSASPPRGKDRSVSRSPRRRDDDDDDDEHTNGLVDDDHERSRGGDNGRVD